MVLGVQHILEGWDHLAFLLAVLRVGGSARWVELAFAASILWVEIGQAAVVAVLLPLVRLLGRRQRLARWLVPGVSGLILVAGTGGLVMRVAG